MGESERASERGGFEVCKSGLASLARSLSRSGEASFFKFCLKRNAACIACNFPLCDCCDDDDDDDCEAAVTFPLREFAVPSLATVELEHGKEKRRRGT